MNNNVNNEYKKISNSILDNSAILECKNLSKNFFNKEAIKGINLKVNKGRIVGLLGPDGSGKSTLIKLANSLLTPTSGDILINGKSQV